MSATLKVGILFLLMLFPISQGCAVTFDDDYVIKSAELPKVREAAAGGDRDASYRLWQFYSMERGDVDEGLFWLRLSAEQGSCEARVGLAGIAFSSLKDSAKARHWLKEARALRCEKAHPVLAEQMRSLDEKLK